jgi:hypothetical protein
VSAQEVIDFIKKERKKIWLVEPNEVKKLLETTGTFGQTCTVVLYIESETRQMVDFLYCLREAAKQEDVTLDSLRTITRTWLDLTAAKAEGWYHLSDTLRIIKEAASALDRITTKDYYNALLEELLLYIGRLNFWIEMRIPWYEIIGTFEWIVHGKSSYH